MARERPLTLSQMLFSQGFGTRRLCEGLVLHGCVTVDGQVQDDPDRVLSPWGEGRAFTVQGQTWHHRSKALLMLHKPAGTECSLKPKHHMSVYTLLPEPLRRRGVQCVGRLDADTTGLILLTDDGPLLRQLTSPKYHVPKVYDVGCRHPVDAAQLHALCAGVQLVDDPQPARALAAQATGLQAPATPQGEALHGLQLVLDEGRYHQVKRMLAAVSNRVETLHRRAIGGLTLPSDLPPGQWRWLDDPQALWTPTPWTPAPKAPAA